MTPLDVARRIESSGSSVRRDPITGLYVVGPEEDPLELTLAQFEAGMRVLALREEAAIGSRR